MKEKENTDYSINNYISAERKYSSVQKELLAELAKQGGHLSG